MTKSSTITTAGETIVHVDEASAVVDDQGASILAGSDYAFEGDTALRASEQSREASAVLDSYAAISDGGSWEPNLVLTVADWAEKMAKGQFEKVSAADLSDQLFTIQTALSKNNTKYNVIDRVSLDIFPKRPGKPQDFQHPTAPMVVFMNIKRGSFLWHDTDQRAMAVWFVPNQTGEHTDIASAPLDSNGKPLDMYDGRYYADTRWLDGYIGVLRYFGSMREAKEAADALRRAVIVAGIPTPSARTEDPMDEVTRQIDLMDEDEARHRKTVPTPAQRQFAARQQSPC